MTEEDVAETSGTKALLLGGKEFLRQIEDNKVKYVVVRRPKTILIHTEIIDLLVEIHDMLQE